MSFLCILTFDTLRNVKTKTLAPALAKNALNHTANAGKEKRAARNAKEQKGTENQAENGICQDGLLI